MFIIQAFWDVIEKKKLGTTKAECSVTSEWSADGRYFMTATTAPRRQVDNGYVQCFLHTPRMVRRRSILLVHIIILLC